MAKKREDRVRPTHVIGYLEAVALPDWGIDSILAKSDTGAKSSAIDVRSIEEMEGDRVRFEVVARREPEEHVWVEAPIVRRTSVRSSFGRSKDRLMVRALLRMGNVEKEVELGLVGRKNMRCRMLLGRTTLEDTFLVDSGAAFVITPKPAWMKRRKKQVEDLEL